MPMIAAAAAEYSANLGHRRASGIVQPHVHATRTLPDSQFAGFAMLLDVIGLTFPAQSPTPVIADTKIMNFW